jgi:hypothetical protein
MIDPVFHFLCLTMFNCRLLDEDGGFVSLRRQCHLILLFVCAEPGERQALPCGIVSENGWNSDPTRLCAAMTHQHIRAEVYLTEIQFDNMCIRTTSRSTDVQHITSLHQIAYVQRIRCSKNSP